MHSYVTVLSAAAVTVKGNKQKANDYVRTGYLQLDLEMKSESKRDCDFDNDYSEKQIH